MKKIIAVITTLFVVAGLFAQEEKKAEASFNFGFGLPIVQSKFEADEGTKKSDVKFNSVNFDIAELEIRAVFKNNVAILAGFGTGLTCSDKLTYDGKKLSDTFGDTTGLYSDVYAGIGYRFLNTQKFNFTLSGLLGIRHIDFEGELKENSKESVAFATEEFFIGLDAFAQYNFNSNWSMFVGVSGNLNFFGSYAFENRTDCDYYDSIMHKEDDTDFGSFTIKPRIGVSYRF